MSGVALLVVTGLAIDASTGRIRSCFSSKLPGSLFVIEPRRQAMLTALGTPTWSAVGPPDGVLAVQDQPFEMTFLLREVAPDQTVEVMMWREYCGASLRSQAIVVLDPQSGKVLEGNHGPLELIDRQHQ